MFSARKTLFVAASVLVTAAASAVSSSAPAFGDRGDPTPRLHACFAKLLGTTGGVAVFRKRTVLPAYEPGVPWKQSKFYRHVTRVMPAAEVPYTGVLTPEGARRMGVPELANCPVRFNLTPHNLPVVGDMADARTLRRIGGTLSVDAQRGIRID